jgi:DNA mismatch endonuclease (patch repair protein)
MLLTASSVPMAMSNVSARGRSRIMRSIRKTDTRPELRVRRLLHGLGFRFRLHHRNLPGTPDIVLPKYHAVIFVHGCFWHQHADCKKGDAPRARPEYWLPKLARNVERDRIARATLAAAGYRVLVLWECKIADQKSLRRTLLRFLAGDDSRRAASS